MERESMKLSRLRKKNPPVKECSPPTLYAVSRRNPPYDL